MNREQIIAKWNGMTPRERDAWVAEVIFGYQPRVDYGNGRVEWYARNPVNGGMSARPFVELPNYTTDISSAWVIVEANKTEFLVRRRLGGTDYRAWIMMDVYNPEYGVYAHGKTAPEAICLAAIIAKMET